MEKEENLLLLSELSHSSELSQRDLSAKLNISLGKTNYLIKQLIERGMIKVVNVAYCNGKVKRAQYILTTKGLKEKMALTYYFLKKKEKEYLALRSEVEKNRVNQTVLH